MRFERYLNESKANELYHVTTYKAAKNIFTHDYLRPTINTETGKSGLSTTKSSKINWGGGGVKLVFNRLKLKKFKLLDVESIVGVDEKEVLIVSKNIIKNVYKYLDRIEIRNRDSSVVSLDELKKILIPYTEKHNIPIKYVK